MHYLILRFYEIHDIARFAKRNISYKKFYKVINFHIFSIQSEYLCVALLSLLLFLGFVIPLALLKIENAFNLFSRRQQGRPHPSKSIEQRRCGGCLLRLAESGPQTQDSEYGETGNQLEAGNRQRVAGSGIRASAE